MRTKAWLVFSSGWGPGWLCLGQELSWGLCLASAVSCLLTFLTNSGSSGAGEEGGRAAGVPSSFRGPAPGSCSPWESLALLASRQTHRGQQHGAGGGQAQKSRSSPGRCKAHISGNCLKHGAFLVTRRGLKTVIRCHFLWRPSLSLGAEGIITHLGPSLPCTAPRTNAT